MYAEIVSAATSLRAAGQIAKALIDLKTMTEVQAKAIELNGLILDAQSDLLTANAAQATLVEENRELKSEIARMKNWEAEKQRYKLIAPFPGCMVYALKKSMSAGETAHYLCAACYKKGQPSILQGREGRVMKGVGKGNAAFVCDVCGSAAEVNGPWVPTPQYFEDIVPQG